MTDGYPLPKKCYVSIFIWLAYMLRAYVHVNWCMCSIVWRLERSNKQI